MDEDTKQHIDTLQTQYKDLWHNTNQDSKQIRKLVCIMEHIDKRIKIMEEKLESLEPEPRLWGKDDTDNDSIDYA